MAGSRPALPESSTVLIKRSRIIQFALIGSVLIYGLAVNLLPLEGESDASDPEGMQMIFSMIGLGACFVSTLVNHLLLKPKRLGIIRDPEQLNGKVFMIFILTWAIAEVCAICGFALAFLLKDPSLYYTFGLLSILTILAHPVTESRLRALMK